MRPQWSQTSCCWTFLLIQEPNILLRLVRTEAGLYCLCSSLIINCITKTHVLVNVHFNCNYFRVSFLSFMTKHCLEWGRNNHTYIQFVCQYEYKKKITLCGAQLMLITCCQHILRSRSQTTSATHRSMSPNCRAAGIPFGKLAGIILS